MAIKLYAGNTVVAEQRTVGSSHVVWHHKDPVTGSFDSSVKNGSLFGDDEPEFKAEFEPSAVEQNLGLVDSKDRSESKRGAGYTWHDREENDSSDESALSEDYDALTINKWRNMKERLRPKRRSFYL